MRVAEGKNFFLSLSFPHRLGHAYQQVNQDSSPSLLRTNPPCLPVPSLLSSSTSSSSNSSSSPSSPSQIYLKPCPQLLHEPDDMTKSFNDSTTTTKLISSLPFSAITNKDSSYFSAPLQTKYSSIPSSCSTMVTPTASLLSAVTTTTTAALTPSNLYAGKPFFSPRPTHRHVARLRSSTFVRPMYKTSLSTHLILESAIIVFIGCFHSGQHIYR